MRIRQNLAAMCKTRRVTPGFAALIAIDLVAGFAGSAKTEITLDRFTFCQKRDNGVGR